MINTIVQQSLQSAEQTELKPSGLGHHTDFSHTAVVVGQARNKGGQQDKNLSIIHHLNLSEMSIKRIYNLAFFIYMIKMQCRGN